MIPGEIFTGFAEFQGNVSVNDFRFPIGLQELLQALLRFLRSFCFARIRLDPLGGEVLHHDCAVIKSPKFSARGTAPPVRLLHGALVILVL